MTSPITCDEPAILTSPSPTTPTGLDHLEGWQLLAAASLSRLLTETELAAAEHLPAEIALDLLFPDLDDAARHEALSAFG